MPGTPSGSQLTPSSASEASVRLMDLSLASAQGWKEGFSSGVTLGSNCCRASTSTGSADMIPTPPLLGNQTPDKSGWPSAVRGAGPPGGNLCTPPNPEWSSSEEFPCWVKPVVHARHKATSAAPAHARSKRSRLFISTLLFSRSVGSKCGLERWHAIYGRERDGHLRVIAPLNPYSDPSLRHPGRRCAAGHRTT